MAPFPPLPTPRPSRSRAAARFCARSARLCLSVATSLAILALVGAGLIAWRLSQGPIFLPEIGEAVAAQVNARSAGSTLSLETVVLNLGEAGTPSGIEFRGVEVVDDAGLPLMTAPRVIARFDLVDLLAGQFLPTRVVVTGADARMIRAEDGRIRFALGRGQGIEFGADAGVEPGTAPPERPDMDAIARIIDGFVGDAPQLRQLTKLEEISILDTSLVYADAITGRRWETRGSSLRIFRTATGARATMDAAVTDDLAVETSIAVAATRRTGTGRADLTFDIDNFHPAVLAGQLDGLGWIGDLDAPVSGQIRLGIGPLGEVLAFEGKIRAEAPEFAMEGGNPLRLRIVHADFDYLPETERLRLQRLEIDGEHLAGAFSGVFGVERAHGVAETGLTGELMVRELTLPGGSAFERDLSFDAGQVVFHADFERDRVKIARAWLGRESFTLAISGEGAQTPDGPRARLRISARDVTVDDLKSHWPRGLGENARLWATENLIDGRIDRMVGHLEIAPDAMGELDARLGLDFRFQDLDSRYLGQMTPIVSAAGRGHLTEDDLHLTVEAGRVEPVAGAPIDISGSRLAFRDFSGVVTPADVVLIASGPVLGALALLDEEPLGLVGALGIAPEAVSGQAEVRATVSFPLLQDLALEQITIDTQATLTGIAMPYRAGGTEIPMRAERLSLTATAEEMTVSGPALVDGVPVDLAWAERYGQTPGERELTLKGAVTPDLLARFGVALDAFESGSIEAEITLLSRGGPTSLRASADLAGASIVSPRLRWSKPQGTPGRLEVSGALGESIAIDRLSLETPDLTATGAIAFHPGGGVAEVRIDALRLAERADLSGTVSLPPPGRAETRPEVVLTGRLLDLSTFIREPPKDAPTEGAPVMIRLDVEELGLTDKIRLRPVRGTVSRTAEGTIALDLEGAAGPNAPFEGTYRREAGAPGRMEVTGSNAGALLAELGFFEGGRGGTLRLEAQLGPETGADLDGLLTIENMQVQGALTLGSIIEQGGVDDAAAAVDDGGLSFREIVVPFAYVDGVIQLDNVVARSPALAIKVGGIVDEAENQLNLVGVISPAYALTGAVNRIPILGQILAGGEGEGIFAMTFNVRGSLNDPSFEVNPLSLLTPGVLRSVFEQQASIPSDQFLEGLDRAN